MNREQYIEWYQLNYNTKPPAYLLEKYYPLPVKTETIETIEIKAEEVKPLKWWQRIKSWLGRIAA